MNLKRHKAFLKNFAFGFLCGGIIAAAVTYFFFQQVAPVKVLRESDITSSGNYTFTDPLLSVTSAGSDAPEYASLQKQVQSYLAAQTASGLSSASVRFGDIEASEGFTVNPDTMYAPASLTKVPLAMAYYALAEQDPSVLAQRITYTGPDLDANEQIKSSVQLVPGQSYTVEQMIEHMIRYSDNNAEQLLADHLSAIGKLDALQSLFNDLGIKPNPENPDYMTAQSYSLFLRVLFNATYLDRDYSEKLLQLLSQTDFSAGLDAGVPNNISIAEKFGDARIPNAAGQQVGAELHNCGIIYYPSHPYLLCVMTKGDTIPDLERIIAGVSQIVFNSVESRYPWTGN
jgi:beta-lactamase class A